MPALGAAIAGLFSSISTFAASSWLAGFAVRIALSIGFSALARALQPKPKISQPGITTEATQTGGTEPQSFILGRYATGGQLVAPPMTHGSAGKTPNAYLTYVIAVSDVPGVALSRLFIDGEVAAVGTVAHPDYGLPVTLKGKADRAWVRFYDGTQTAADPMLIAKYGAHPQRPWSSDMIGRGTAYAILTFRFDRDLYKGFPAARFELDGIPLYDPRQDPSAGGTGTQAWTDPATWTRSSNPAVMAYNVLRGVTVHGADVWGGGWQDTELPLAEWVTAMNACDVPVALAAGGTEPAWRAGFEVAVDREPADVLEELMKTCVGRMADIGGTMKIAVGAPGLPILAITDDDIIVTDEQTHSLFPSLAQTHNGVHATFPDPASLWENRDAPPRYDAAAETEDGQRLIATVTLPACPYAVQVQRLMQAWVNEERRFRRHQLVLPPDATILEPHDVISWTSVRNGYSAKLLEVVEIAHDPVSLLQMVSLREVDPADYDWSSALELPWVAPLPGASLPAAQTVPAFAVAGTALDDAASVARRPALLLTWDGSGQDDVSALEYEVRRLGGAQVIPGVTTNVAGGSQIVAAGILPDTVYEARARFVAPRPMVWTGWAVATTPSAYITLDDFGGDFTPIFTDAGLTVPKLVSSLPPAAPERFAGELVYLTTDNKIYRWTGSAWTAAVPFADLTGTIAAAQIAAGTITGNKIVANTITGGLLATTGIITQVAQITDAIITGAKIADLSVDTLKIAGNAVTVPARAFNSAIVNIDAAYPTEFLVTSVSLTRAAGFVTEIHFSSSYSSYNEAVIDLIIKRGTAQVVIMTATSAALGRATTIAFSIFDQNTAGGATTYNVYARKSDPAGTAGWNNNALLVNSFLSVVQFKR